VWNGQGRRVSNPIMISDAKTCILENGGEITILSKQKS